MTKFRFLFYHVDFVNLIMVIWILQSQFITLDVKEDNCVVIFDVISCQHFTVIDGSVKIATDSVEKKNQILELVDDGRLLYGLRRWMEGHQEFDWSSLINGNLRDVLELGLLTKIRYIIFYTTVCVGPFLYVRYNWDHLSNI